jgi:hypothetical protein
MLVRHRLIARHRLKILCKHADVSYIIYKSYGKSLVKSSAVAGFILARRVGWMWALAGLVGSVTLTSSGFVLQVRLRARMHVRHVAWCCRYVVCWLRCIYVKWLGATGVFAS